MSDRERFVRPPSAESVGEARGEAGSPTVASWWWAAGRGSSTQRPIQSATATRCRLLFAREGAHVAVADRNEDSAQETVDMIRKEGGRAFTISADITDEEHVGRMMDEARIGLGGMDGMVLNVGIGAGTLGLANVKADDWDMTLATNLRGPMLCCRDALPVLADGSSIVFISSIAGITSGSRLPAYDASKAALGGLMRHVAARGCRPWHPSERRRPGLVDTPLGRLATGDGLRARRRTCRSGVRPRRGRSRMPYCSSCQTRAST